jgi:serine/threonine protein kinase
MPFVFKQFIFLKYHVHNDIFTCRVKYGINKETGERVAIKIISKAKLAKQNMEKQTKKEILIMKRINHPNIVKLFDVYQTKTKLYLIMELVTGGELFEKIAQEGKLSESQSRRYFQQLIDAIDYMHNIGVCHRDLKPENILIDEDDCIHISDFGLSAVIFQDSTPPLPTAPSTLTMLANQTGTALSESVNDLIQYESSSMNSSSSSVTTSNVSISKLKASSPSLSPSQSVSSSPLSTSPSLGNSPSTSPNNTATISPSSSTVLTPTQRGVRLHAPCGTPHYSAPEVLQPTYILASQGYLGPPVDVWSAGVILFVMNAGCILSLSHFFSLSLFFSSQFVFLDCHSLSLSLSLSLAL